MIALFTSRWGITIKSMWELQIQQRCHLHWSLELQTGNEDACVGYVFVDAAYVLICSHIDHMYILHHHVHYHGESLTFSLLLSGAHIDCKEI